MINADKLPYTMIIFGVTGDLVRQKVAPALFHLHETGNLPDRFVVVGFSRRHLTDNRFRKIIYNAVASHLGNEKEVRADFLDKFVYQQGDFSKKADYIRLYGRLRDLDRQWSDCSNKLFHLAVPPGYYKVILEYLSFTELANTCGPGGGWTRILVEKPFGTNLDEAEKLDDELGKLFKEDQIYRIDHYVAKEMLQNIVFFRFANNLLENRWDRQTIEQIEIKLLEKEGVKDRGAFYDRVGALMDIGQNHILQMLALVAMDAPVNLTALSIRKNRAKILKRLRALTAGDIKRDTVRGQYYDYQKEKEVKRDSRTETYFKIRTTIENRRWDGVKVILEAGKKAPITQKEISVTFYPSKTLFRKARATGIYKNIVTFRIEPEPGIAVKFWSKRPGPSTALEEQVLDFKYQDIESGERHLEGYAKVILDCIKGDQTLFITSPEANAGWRFIDPIVKGWRKEQNELHYYSDAKQFYDMASRIG